LTNANKFGTVAPMRREWMRTIKSRNVDRARENREKNERMLYQTARFAEVGKRFSGSFTPPLW